MIYNNDDTEIWLPWCSRPHAYNAKICICSSVTITKLLPAVLYLTSLSSIKMKNMSFKTNDRILKLMYVYKLTKLCNNLKSNNYGLLFCKFKYFTLCKENVAFSTEKMMLSW